MARLWCCVTNPLRFPRAAAMSEHWLTYQPVLLTAHPFVVSGLNFFFELRNCLRQGCFLSSALMQYPAQWVELVSVQNKVIITYSDFGSVAANWKEGGEGRRYAKQSILGFIWAGWWQLFPGGSSLQVLCASPQLISDLSLLPPALVSHWHMLPPSAEAGAPGILLQPSLPTTSTHRSEHPKQRGHNTSEDALSQPQEERHLPQSQSSSGLYTEDCWKALWQADFGPVFKVQVVMWNTSVEASGSRSCHHRATELAPFSPWLPGTAVCCKTTACPVPPCTPPTCGTVHHCHIHQWEIVWEIWARPQPQSPSWQAQEMGFRAAVLATIPRCMWFEECVASRLEEQVCEDSLESLSLDKQWVHGMVSTSCKHLKAVKHRRGII